LATLQVTSVLGLLFVGRQPGIAGHDPSTGRIFLGDQDRHLSRDEDGYAYNADYLAGWQPRVVFLSMPLRDGPYADRVARPFVSSLLPDDGVFGLSAGNTFGLLEVIGGECAGAFSGRNAGSFDNDGVKPLAARDHWQAARAGSLGREEAWTPSVSAVAA